MATIMSNDYGLLEPLLEDFGIVKTDALEIRDGGTEWSASSQSSNTEAMAESPSTPRSSQSNNANTIHHQIPRISEEHEARAETPRTSRASEETDSHAGTATPTSTATTATEYFGRGDLTPGLLSPWTPPKAKSPEASSSTPSRNGSPSIRLHAKPNHRIL
jgi:hypothetical protein